MKKDKNKKDIKDRFQWGDRVQFKRICTLAKEGGEGVVQTFKGRIVFKDNNIGVRYESGGHRPHPLEGLLSQYDQGYVIFDVESIPERKWDTIDEFLNDQDITEQWLRLGYASMCPAHDTFFKGSDAEFYFRKWIKERPQDISKVVEHCQLLFGTEESNEHPFPDYEIAGWMFLLYDNKHLKAVIEIAEFILEDTSSEQRYMSHAIGLAKKFIG